MVEEEAEVAAVVEAEEIVLAAEDNNNNNKGQIRPNIVGRMVRVGTPVGIATILSMDINITPHSTTN